MRWGVFALAALTALIVAGAGVMATQLRDLDGPARIDVAPVVVAVATSKSYAYVVHGDTGVVLIDSGSDSSAQAILDELARTKQSVADIRAILITSPHPFTLAGLDTLRTPVVFVGAGDEDMVRGSRVIRAPVARLWTRMHAHGKHENPTQPLLAGARVVVDGVVVEAIATPGVTEGGRSYVVRNIAFVGPAFRAHDGKLTTPSFWIAEAPDSLTQSLQRLSTQGFSQLAASTFAPFADGHALFTNWESTVPESLRLRSP
jgi:glyoxylase-like metal-dependent hydrolase (beta-lactamase superfamily II)